MAGEVGSIVIEETDDGQRLDRWLKKRYPAVGFGEMQKILRTGQIRVDGKRVKGDARLAAGQTLRIPPQLSLPPSEKPKNRDLSPKDEAFIQSLVIYKDDHLIAINKPQGLATQGGTKVNRHVDGMLDGLKFDGLRPHLVHRLDRETSGVLLLARSPKMAQKMGDLFKGRDIRKYYWAVTSPAPSLPQGKIQSAIAKVQSGDGERVMTVSDDDGKMALTFYHVMESLGRELAWVAFWPRTGRTHQIRVHAVEMGCPLLGDDKYDRAQAFLSQNPGLPQGLHLHARRLIFRHPVTGKRVDITAPLGPDMKKTFKYFGFSAEDKSDPFADLD